MPIYVTYRCVCIPVQVFGYLGKHILYSRKRPQRHVSCFAAVAELQFGMAVAWGNLVGMSIPLTLFAFRQSSRKSKRKQFGD